MTDSEKLERIRNYCEEMIPEAKELESDAGVGMAMGLATVLEIMDADKCPAPKEKKLTG